MRSTIQVFTVIILSTFTLMLYQNCGPAVYSLAGASVATESLVLSSGFYHACAIVNNGSVKCWGYNSNGQLGNGTNVNSTSAVDASNLTDVQQVSLSGEHSCALTILGTVKCWGAGWFLHKRTPTEIIGLTDIRQISLALGHTCALTNFGSVKCWGQNTAGELGDNTTNDTTVTIDGVPSLVDVVGLNDVKQLSSEENTCVLTAQNTVMCWGANESGQLGNGTFTESHVPVEVVGLSNIKSISTGVKFNCAITAENTVKCWGKNRAGQLGNNSTINSALPVDVIGLTRVKQLSLGNEHACALISGRGVYCWGYNRYGQVGLGNFPPSGSYNVMTPARVVELTSADQISLGHWHSCAMTTDKQVKCWGRNSYGQLGNGTLADSAIPTKVLGL